MAFTFNPFSGELDYYQPAVSSSNFADGEVLSGATDGVNTTFTTAHTPNGAIFMLEYNGARIYVNEDYTLVGSTVTTTSFIPESGTKIRCSYTF